MLADIGANPACKQNPNGAGTALTLHLVFHAGEQMRPLSFLRSDGYVRHFVGQFQYNV